MPRRTPPDRLLNIASSACRVFIAKGYRRALLTDVGNDLGLSHAILYRYVASKEALFELALIYAMDPDAVQALPVPVPAPPKGRALELFRKWAADQAPFAHLRAATGDCSGDPARELAGIIDECYTFIEGNRLLLSLILHSALDIPELRDCWFDEIRGAYLRQLTDYLRLRIGAGKLRQVPDEATAARFITEAIAWFAWHRHGDPGSEVINDDDARQTVRALLLAAFVPAEPAALRTAADILVVNRLGGWHLSQGA